MKAILTAATIAVLSASGALAADLPARAYTKAPPIVAPAFDWTGFYVGGEVGGSWSDSRWTTTSLVNVGTGLPITGIDASSPRNFSSSGIRAGGYAGYNWRASPNIVWGIEGDIAYADHSNRTVGIPGCTILCTAPFVAALGPDQATVQTRWDASLRARLGFLVTPDALIYGTGGVAWQNITTSATCAHTPTDSFCGFLPAGTIVTNANSFNQVGWTVGVGIDWHVFGNWIARAEYRYSQFSDANGLLNLSAGVDTSTIAYNLRTNINIATVGIAYKFGGPVVAKY
jgi:outer membrane immunogenic protein